MLEKYSDEWGVNQAAHLLRRSVFGPTFSMIHSFAEIGLDEAINKLFDVETQPSPPINYNYNGDPEVPAGETWVYAGFDAANRSNNYRLRSIRGWVFSQMLNQGSSILEKLVLFWHNHFVIANNNDARFLYKYNQTLRDFALGNFKDFVKRITIDPAMLRYLNGNQNKRQAPNENYSRELMELFTLGKGDLAGPGDYTTFTEEDVLEIAKVLTGWKDFGFRRDIPEEIKFGSYFIENNHTSSSKQLSHRFGEIVIENSGEQEYSDLIDVIFENEEVSKFICRKLYRWFVYYKIDDDIEESVIGPLAEHLRSTNYEIEPVLKSLLSSEHFFDDAQRGCIIKSPIEYVVTMLNQLEIEWSQFNTSQQYRFWLTLFKLTGNMQMEYFGHPTVAGWKAYYQEPSYYQLWINSATLGQRNSYTNQLILEGINYGDTRVGLNALKLIENISNPTDVNVLLRELILLLFPKELNDDQIGKLKEVIIPGLPDFEWTLEYAAYLANPDDEETKRAVEIKLSNLILFMLRMPEYQLM